MNLDEFVDRYVKEVVLDDPALLCIEDMWPWWDKSEEERATALAVIQTRAGEMKRFAPGEEMSWIKTISSHTSKWTYQHARKEPTTYHLFPQDNQWLEEKDKQDPWPTSMTVRLTSALGVFLKLAEQLNFHVHVSEENKHNLTVTTRALVLTGLSFGGAHSTLQNAYREVMHGPLPDRGDEAFAQSVADTIAHKTLVPPRITSCLVKYPSIWKTYTRDYRDIVLQRKYRKIEHHLLVSHPDYMVPGGAVIEPNMLLKSWSPEAVLAMRHVWEYRIKEKGIRRTFDTDYARLCIEFLKSKGLWERVVKMLAEEDQYHGPFVLEDSGED